MKIVLLGSGNLATNIGLALKHANVNIIQVFSQTVANAKCLAEKIGCEYTASTEAIYKADIYISALKDSVATEVWSKINFNDKLLLHTSGSLSIDLLKEHSTNYGVIYPLMTLSKDRVIPFDDIPILVEGNTSHNEKTIESLARQISSNVTIVNSTQRSQLHLAAVWANNFSNHMYAVAKQITDENNLPFSILLPLIDETAKKVHNLEPKEAQTGPAIRYDKNIIDKHIAANAAEYRDLYKLISESIHKLAIKK